MTDTVPSPPGGDVTTEAFLARVPEARLLRLRVAEIADLTTEVRLVRLAGADLAGFGYHAGQDLMVMADNADGRIIRRRYTIRRFDRPAGTLDLHVVTQTGGPGSRWALGLRPGDPVEGIGPRGKIMLDPHAEAHLFLGDEVAVPAIAAMVEALAPNRRAVVRAEVADATEQTTVEPPPQVAVDWVWLHRDGVPAGSAQLLTAAAADLPIPPVPTRVYVFAEVAVVAGITDVLRQRGLDPAAVSAKAYWGRGRANASHGEPVRERG